MQRGDIFYVGLTTPEGNLGREQIGSRPALIIHSNNTLANLPVLMVIPITSQLSANRFPHTILVQPSHQNGLTTPSLLLIFQLRAIDRNRIKNKIGQLEPVIMTQVEKELRNLLELS